MQDYTYSIFSLVAIAINLMINFKVIIGRGSTSSLVRRYRGFLIGVLTYYVSDAAWGILAGLDWIPALYVDTIFYFLSLVFFVYMLSDFVVAYLPLGKWPAKILKWFGCALLLFNVVLLLVNCHNKCFFYFDANNIYRIGDKRYMAFSLLIAFNALIAIFVLAKALASRDAVRRRSMMVFLFCLTIAVAIVLQVIWPLTPFTALGCLLSNCFFHVFVVQDEESARHMARLEQALARARSAEKSRSMFFSIVSHDIRTPLNAIIGYSELLQYGIKNKSERDEALRSIRASGTTLLELVNDVLDLAKLDAGKMTLHPEPVNLAQLADDVFASFRKTAAEKGIELLVRIDGLPVLLLDEHRFRQVLFNLVGNAVKFTQRGSVTVAASYIGGCLDLSVKDTGCGIAENMLTRILDPFVQVQDPRHAADRTGGTGLGLSICKSLIETMGGELSVTSELGKGSTFRARIPGVSVSGEPPAATVAAKPVCAPEALPRHVLVVDDSSVNRITLTAFLRKAGITAVDHACDGTEALSRIRHAAEEGCPYDFVFSDLWMPNMNGLEFVEKIRSSSRFSRLPVYAVTADTEFGNDPRHGLFTGILLKPLTYDRLMSAFVSA